MAESSVAGGAAVARVVLATASVGVCAWSAAGNARVAAMNSLMIRVIDYFFCVGGVPVRAPTVFPVGGTPG
jgi:hypothetical protein